MKHFYIILVGLVISHVSCSQPQEATTDEKNLPKLEEGTNNSLLWMVTKENSKDTSFVFGTMHLIQKKYYYFPDLLKEVIQASDLVVLEIGEEMNNPFKAMKLLQLEEGKSMFDFFNEAQKDSILDWAQQELNMSPEMFETSFGKMKPFVLVSTASEMDMLSDSESYERTIMKVQKEAEIKLEGLETLEEQMSIFDDLTDEEQATMVMEAIRGDEDADKQLETMMRLYSQQNLDSMYLLIKDESASIADKEDEFLTDRNKKWIPKMDEMMKGKRVFFAVGAGHLGGDQGVLELLRDEGFKVSPVKL